VAVAAALLACARIAATWPVFTETYDEATQIACGMEWLDAGRYTLEAQHPPLARIAFAIGPWLAGARSNGIDHSIREGQAILHSRGDEHYFRMLGLARAGNLVFVLLACLGVWLLARGYGGPAQAAWAVVAFTLLPPILGHGGVATTDMALVAMVLLAVVALRRAALRPRAGTAALAGVAAGLAFVAKFSAPVFLPLVLLAVAPGWRASWGRRHLRLVPLAALACFLTVWAVYRFETAPLHAPGAPELPMANRLVGDHGPLHAAAYRVLDTPLPLPTVVRGFAELYVHNGLGHDAYLMGEVRRTGWWYFYPAVLALKTPLAFMLLVGLGGAWLAREQRWRELAPFLAAALLVGLSLLTGIDTGVRYLLLVYALAAVSAGYAIARLAAWNRVVAAVVVLGWAATGAVAHPDYLAEFNPLAGPMPERFLTDSDLDWGQDLHRMTAALVKEGAGEAHLAYFGVYDFSRERRVRYRHLPPGQEVRGWVAVSLRTLYFEHARKAQGFTQANYDWLARHPSRRVGRSMLLFRVR
jgi:hypothetical protein